MSNEWLSSREAARRLGVSAATLYAYVSRGLLRSEAVDGRRERRYRADDISRLKRRRDVGRKAESIANHALDFGTPVLESALTLIEDGRLYYRGLDATELARTASLEEIARLLWNCDDRPFAADNIPPMTTALRRAWLAAATLSPVDRCLVLLPAAAALDHPSWVEDRSAMLETGVRFCPNDGTPLTETSAQNTVPTPAGDRPKSVEIALPAVVGGRYRLEEKRGGGGMAKVYRAVDVTLEREVAVKLINQELRQEEEFDARFQREAS